MNFLSFIKKRKRKKEKKKKEKGKVLFQVLGHLHYVFFSPNKCLKKIQRENNRGEYTREEEGKEKRTGREGKEEQVPKPKSKTG